MTNNQTESAERKAMSDNERLSDKDVDALEIVLADAVYYQRLAYPVAMDAITKLCAQAKSPPVAVAAELPEMPPQFYAVKWHCGGEMFYAGNMLVVEKDRYNALHTRAEQIIAAKEAQLPDGMKHCTILFKECAKGHGWLTATNWVQHDCPTCAKESAESRLAVVEAALETLLDKCPNCGGTGMVETGRIQFGYPSDSPCGLCSNERKVFDAALQGVKP